MLRFNFDNDFKFTIIPKLNDEPIDLSELEDLSLSVRNSFRSANFTPIWEIKDTGIEIEVQKEMIKWTGVYTVFLTYRRPDGTYSDFFQDKKIGCPTFEIVPVGCKTDNDGEDVVIEVSPEYKGDPGDSAYQIAVDNGFVGTEEEWLESLHGQDGKDFTYEDFTPEQIENLQRPAIEAVERADQSADNANTAADNANDATLAANNAASNANTAADNANDAANHPTYIAPDNYVYIWNKENQEYEKTDIYVKGDNGDTIINQANGLPLKMWVSDEDLPDPQENDIIYIQYE